MEIKTNNQSVQLYILSRDRPDYLRETLKSAVKQNANDVEIIVSDNSVGDDVEKMLALEFPTIKYIRRSPPLNIFEHFKSIINEVTADLFVMFHDDDVLFPDYVTSLRNCLTSNSKLAAVGCKAAIMRDKKITNEFVPSVNKNITLSTPEEFINEYFSISQKGAAPFPGYMYRRCVMAGVFLDPDHGGKYADVSFLMRVILRGQILWTNTPLMAYRVHSKNASITESLRDRRKLLKYVYSNTTIRKKSIQVSIYRYRYLLAWFLEQETSKSKTKWRLSIIRRFILKNTLMYILINSEYRKQFVAKLWRITSLAISETISQIAGRK